MFNLPIGQLLQKPAPILFALACVGGVMLFAPTWFVEALSLADFVAKYRELIGPAFLAACAWLLAIAAIRTPGWFHACRKWVNVRRNRKLLFEHLTNIERDCLAALMVADEPVVYMKVGDGTLQNLIAHRVIFTTSRTVDILKGVPYSLSPWARRLLLKRPDIIDGYDGSGFLGTPERRY